MTRPARTYRADRKRRARQRGISLAELDAQDARARELAARRVRQIELSMTPEQKRRALALWAQSGGKVNPITGEGMQ